MMYKRVTWQIPTAAEIPDYSCQNFSLISFQPHVEDVIYIVIHLYRLQYFYLL